MEKTTRIVFGYGSRIISKVKTLLLPGAAALTLVLSTGLLQAQTVVRAQDTKGTPDERATLMVKQLTLDEKISLLGGDTNGFSTVPIDRLGILKLMMTDGPQGVRSGSSCAFPAGVALAATFDQQLAAAYGKAMGLEGRARGTHFQLGPALNICRVPVNGRNFEYFGEDPFLTGVITTEWARECTKVGVVPTIKHFAGNSQEWNRMSVDAQIDERVLREIYLPGFEKAVKEAGNIAVMCSYNRLNGHYASNNDWLLNQVLKQDWGFKGLLMSDWSASHQVSDLTKGMDLEMPRPVNLSPANVKAALSNGTLKEADIDNALHRFLRTAFAEGWLDAGWQQKDSSLPLDSPASDEVALQVARGAIVLLKNDSQLLPLDRGKVKNIVVVGPNASARAEGQLPNNIGGGGSGAVTPFATRYASADYYKSIARLAGNGVKVTYLPMPADAGDDVFTTFVNARTAPNGEPGLKLTVEVTGEGAAVQIPPTVQKAINATWTAGALPFGVPAGRNATYTWSGVLVPEKDSDWQIAVTGRPTITIAGKVLDRPAGEVINLTKGKPIPIEIQLRATANAGNGARGGQQGNRGQAANTIRVGLEPPAIPDLSVARNADALIVCVGFDRSSESEGSDHTFDLPSLQGYLLDSAVAANRSHTIVINNSGSGVGLANWADKAGAVLQAWYLGQEGGTAIAEVLFGDVNPSGRLASTFDRRFEDNPAFAYYPGRMVEGQNYPVEPYTEGLFYGYRGYDKAGKSPLYPFGYGLSYTTFKLSNLKVQTGANQTATVTVDVSNTGRRAGAEVVQIYVGENNAKVARPLRELKGFSKVLLQPGETRTVTVPLNKRSFAYWDISKKDWTVDLGNRFTIEAGTSERDIALKQTLVVQ
jgi:beta-glucosidase